MSKNKGFSDTSANRNSLALYELAAESNSLDKVFPTEKFNPLMALGIVAGIILVMGGASRLRGNNEFSRNR